MTYLRRGRSLMSQIIAIRYISSRVEYGGPPTSADISTHSEHGRHLPKRNPKPNPNPSVMWSGLSSKSNRFFRGLSATLSIQIVNIGWVVFV